MVCALGNKVADFTACDRLGPAQLDAILPALGPPRRRRAAALPHAASLPLGSEEEEEEAAAGAEVEDADAGASSQAEDVEEGEEEVLRDSLLREVRAAKSGSAKQRQLMARWNSEVPVARRFPPPRPARCPSCYSCTSVAPIWRWRCACSLCAAESTPRRSSSRTRARSATCGSW